MQQFSSAFSTGAAHANQAQGIYWQYLGDGDQWCDYDAATNAQIEAGYVNYMQDPTKNTVRFKSKGWEYEIEFDFMVQKNLFSQKMREVNRNTQPASKAPAQNAQSNQPAQGQSSLFSNNNVNNNLQTGGSLFVNTQPAQAQFGFNYNNNNNIFNGFGGSLFANTQPAQAQIGFNNNNIFTGVSGNGLFANTQPSNAQVPFGQAAQLNEPIQQIAPPPAPIAQQAPLPELGPNEVRFVVCERRYTLNTQQLQATQSGQVVLRVLDVLQRHARAVQDRSLQKDAVLAATAQHMLLTPAEFCLIKALHHEEAERLKKRVPEEEQCSICLTELYEFDDANAWANLTDQCDIVRASVQKRAVADDDVVQLARCGSHFFHKQCIMSMPEVKQGFIRCPVCSVIYGVMTGNQPPGTMNVQRQATTRCSGYENCGTIVISYQFPNGVLPDGTRYSGTNRVGYLPDNDEGREVLRLLQTAFDRKLIFTVGTSVTTGQKNTTVWNGIHHKTSTHGGSSNYGYPDATYLKRVKEELATKGVY